MASIFVSGTPAPKTAAQRKISSLAIRVNSAKRKASQSGPCIVIYKQAPAA